MNKQEFILYITKHIITEKFITQFCPDDFFPKKDLKRIGFKPEGTKNRMLGLCAECDDNDCIACFQETIEKLSGGVG